MDHIQKAIDWIKDRVEHDNVQMSLAIDGARKLFKLNEGELTSVKTVLEFEYERI